MGVGTPKSSWGGKAAVRSHTLPVALCSRRSPGGWAGTPRSSSFHPGPHLEGVGGGLWGALEPSLKLYIQDVEQVRGLGLAGEVDAEVEAADSTGAVVMELARVVEY